MTASPPSFLSLLEAHEALDELFLQHQKALLMLDIPRALQQLREFEHDLRAHMRLEEELLLPIYRRAGPIPGGAVELFTSEHRKMLEFLAQFKERLEQPQDQPEDGTRATLQLLDRESLFKHLVEHHDLREQNILYPTLDQVASEQERADLLASGAGYLT